MKIERFALEPIDVEVESNCPLLCRLWLLLTYWRFVRLGKITPTIKNEKTGEETPYGMTIYRLFYARIKVLKAL